MESLAMSAARLSAVVLLFLTNAVYANPDDLAKPVMLVAKPELMHPLYGRSVLVVKPFGGSQHVGFILNRPTEMTVGGMFPEHAPSQKIAAPIYVGGPVDAQMMFALVEGAESPGGKAFEVAPGLFAAYDAPTVDRIIESGAKHARFVVGMVVWRPGELRAEVEQGAWHVLDFDRKLALREPKGLWEELVRKSRFEEEHRARSVRTAAPL